jgi:hypothetical protein
MQFSVTTKVMASVTPGWFLRPEAGGTIHYCATAVPRGFKPARPAIQRNRVQPLAAARPVLQEFLQREAHRLESDLVPGESPGLEQRDLEAFRARAEAALEQASPGTSGAPGALHDVHDGEQVADLDPRHGFLHGFARAPSTSVSPFSMKPAGMVQ